MFIYSFKIKILIIIQDSKECHCGNQTNTTTFTTDSEDGCSSNCRGNASQTCGGDLKISIYKLGIHVILI